MGVCNSREITGGLQNWKLHALLGGIPGSVAGNGICCSSGKCYHCFFSWKSRCRGVWWTVPLKCCCEQGSFRYLILTVFLYDLYTDYSLHSCVLQHHVGTQEDYKSRWPSSLKCCIIKPEHLASWKTELFQHAAAQL